MPFPFVLCDVFTDRAFAGNPLAVVFDAEPLDDTVMAALAREFGWSEITFVQGAHPPRFRIWTPYGELPFAGHPTVGTSVALAAEGRLPEKVSEVELGAGRITVEILDVGPQGGRATMEQRIPAFGAVMEDQEMLARALGLEVADFALNLPAQVVSTGSTQFLVPLRSLEALSRPRLSPELFPPLLQRTGARWAYLFTVDTPGDSAAARARLLRVGAEDAATGSAAGPLGAYLVNYGLHRAGRMDIEQGVEMGRPSRIQVDVLQAAGEITAVRVSGQVRIWGRGVLDEDTLMPAVS